MATPIALSPNLLSQPQATTAAELAARGKTKATADKFESQFLAQMIGHMFAGIQTDGPFGGGFGEEMFRSVMTDAMAQQMTRSGGIGVSGVVQREMLKMQGLT